MFLLFEHIGLGNPPRHVAFLGRAPFSYDKRGDREGRTQNARSRNQNNYRRSAI